MSANCPYCEPKDYGWGGSGEMWAQLREWHDAGHPSRPVADVVADLSLGAERPGGESDG